MAGAYSARYALCLAAGEAVDRVGRDAVAALAAVDDVALAVDHVDRVAAAARRDPVGARPPVTSSCRRRF